MANYGLIGKSLKHSFSKDYFEKKFAINGWNHTYENFELDSIQTVDSILNKGLRGVNVTIPYKQAIIPYLDELSPLAKQIGAVNTVVFQKGKKIGYNTDAFGFKQMIKPYFKSHHERAIILGTGGASMAVEYVLRELGSAVIFISRRKSAENVFSYEDMNELMMKYSGIIVNTTPIGTFPQTDEYPDIPYKYLTEKHLVIDLIYNPKMTRFLELSRGKGAVILNGETMLHQQAEQSWKLWNNL
jgi:shikimate dehydrogenase